MQPPYNWRNGITGEWHLQIWWKFPFEMLLEKREEEKTWRYCDHRTPSLTWPFHASSLSCFNYEAIDMLQFLDKTYIVRKVQILKCKKQDGFLLAYVMSYPSFLLPPVPTSLMSLSSDAISSAVTWLTAESWEMPIWIKTSKLTERSSD